MVDAREQILELLREIDYPELKVKMQFPKQITAVPLVTYFEMTNTGTTVFFVDKISFQFDVWTETFESCIDLMQLVDKKITGLGLIRDYVSPDSDVVDASGYYRKTLRYSRKVDTRTNRLID